MNQLKMNKWFNKSIKQCIDETMNQWNNKISNFNDSMNQWINDSIIQWNNEWMNETMKQWINELINNYLIN